MANVGHLCYSKTSPYPLAYSVDRFTTESTNPLIYSIEPGGETIVTFAWNEDLKDLDILAYWEGDPNLTAGFGHGSGGTSGVYSIKYSGDIQSTSASEWCKIKMSKWSGTNQRTFKVHFNVFGSGEDYTGNTCTVIASQTNGAALIKNNQPCSMRHGSKAIAGDPYCVVTFDEDGKLVSLE